ncbi:hypothetical protein [Marinobacter apostichopi]|uniref:hypothetical protein n=1 Tax=Marinobacter apostichopi TaxID=3035454 RepID=UPI0025731F52|nr:hypothetical protein [Marinobacter sp. LA51]
MFILEQQWAEGRTFLSAVNGIKADIVDAGVDVELYPLFLEIALQCLVGAGFIGALDFRHFSNQLRQL